VIGAGKKGRYIGLEYKTGFHCQYHGCGIQTHGIHHKGSDGV